MTTSPLSVAAALVVAALAASQLAAQDAAPPDEPGLHAPFDALLAEFVADDGLVDYAGLAEDTTALDDYLAALGEVDPGSLDRDERMAFWINAYNAFTLRLILDHWPDIESIKDISRGARWLAERWDVGGERYSLDAIEHEILRPMGDARIHFALVCAALSCPDLAREAYVAERLDEQLDRQGRAFLRDPTKGLRTYVHDGWFGDTPTVEVSAIFDWFEDDFEEHSGGVVDFVLPYASERDAAFIRRHRDDLDVEHFDYDWSLNAQR